MFSPPQGNSWGKHKSNAREPLTAKKIFTMLSRLVARRLSSHTVNPVRRRAELEETLLGALRSSHDPLLSTLHRPPDLVRQGLVTGVEVDEARRNVAVSIRLPTAAHCAQGELTKASTSFTPWEHPSCRLPVSRLLLPSVFAKGMASRSLKRVCK